MCALWSPSPVVSVLLLLVFSARESLNQELSRQQYAGRMIDLDTAESSSRDPKWLSMFKIVRFQNSECTGISGESGTCYTNKECKGNGGTTMGSCALGFGVCCSVALGCGGASGGNNSYFVGPSTLGSSSGSCQFRIIGDGNICQYRLELEQFSLAPPSTPGAGICSTDQFSVSGANTYVPIICGTNSGQHMIFNTNGRGNDITLSVSAISTFAQRQWRIRVIKYGCNCPYLAPQGCLQYFTATTGQIKSFNFLPNSEGNKIAGNTYPVCIRNEVGFCGICYSQCFPPSQGGFSVSGSNMNAINNKMPTPSTTPATAKSCLTDFITIPCGGTTFNPAPTCGGDRFCGGTLNAGTTSPGTAVPGSVCSVQQPFKLSVYFDTENEAGQTNNAGFCLNYVQQACGS